MMTSRQQSRPSTCWWRSPTWDNAPIYISFDVTSGIHLKIPLHKPWERFPDKQTVWLAYTPYHQCHIKLINWAANSRHICIGATWCCIRTTLKCHSSRRRNVWDWKGQDVVGPDSITILLRDVKSNRYLDIIMALMRMWWDFTILNFRPMVELHWLQVCQITVT